MSQTIAAVLTTVIFFVAVIVVVVICQLYATTRAKIKAARDEDYRKLAERAAAAEQSLAESGQLQAKSLADISARLEAIEKLLRQVE